jgi:cation diffusion facilitator family transporter
MDHDDHDHAHHHQDTNFRAAYVHVTADALTSVLAIVALLAGRFYGLSRLDPVMGLIGMGVILAWSASLIRSAGAVLLDTVPNATLSAAIRDRLETGGDRVADLHLWRLGPGHSGLIASVVTEQPRPPAEYKARLADIPGLSHVTVEVHACPEHAAATSPRPA